MDVTTKTLVKITQVAIILGIAIISISLWELGWAIYKHAYFVIGWH